MLPPEDKVRVPLNFKLQLLPSQSKLFTPRDQQTRKGRAGILIIRKNLP